ncbi:MAG: ABC transporter permease [Solirubrobacterales bacterium]|nr:ABC transporter permease [Solirubrobacterales bacterium]
MSPAAVLAQAPEGFFTQRDPENLDCVAQNGFCPSWIAENWDRYVDPFFQHVYLTLVSLTIGFAIAFTLGLLAHRQRWLAGPLTAMTSVLYTIPSIALFLMLLPLTGRGNTTALIALVAYTQLIIFRNVVNGLRQVPPDIVDAAEGMGLTSMQTLLRVEVPMALPEILAGLRIAASTIVGLATLAFFAGAGGLGAEIAVQINFKSNVVVAGGLAVLLAAGLDLAVLGIQRALMPWRRAVAA